MKKLMNDPRAVTEQTVAGYVRAHAGRLRRVGTGYGVARVEPLLPGTVAVIGGGGSGHEPMHLGYVGAGLLAGAVPGEIFSAPTPEAILEVVTATHAGAGVLFVVGNYSGDRFNFELAAERCAERGIPTHTVVVADDVGLGELIRADNRRGIAGMLVAAKVLGAAAERGDDLESLAEIGARLGHGIASMGVGLRAGTSPLADVASFDLGEDEMEIGIGIHGELGRDRLPRQRADAIADLLVGETLAELAPPAGDSLLVFVNGLGGTPPGELALFFDAVARSLEGRGYGVARVLVGTHVTALDMQGVSLTLGRFDSELLSLWDAPVDTPALRAP
ncbi:dihydroxyacetone kinase subunit DhaK [Mycetocola tolaasinivorans]|uniref:Dihydroxyacetone kinase subunit DhaK n=1 Tax=Mycetocola tolaasinivorans TaxID=76635 RepID=A0A3L7ACK5_9MICO|nr:dihydroxyacetone kinase subunit DhaK [Mycetocola tolaasinivorans]RLP78093.1 dihydroxyacetone kinase subunit DhaK [Mycetocola tolaasinivorans]